MNNWDNSYIGFKKDDNDKDPKFKVGDHVRISRYKYIFAKGYTPNGSEEIFVVSKIKNTVPWTYVIKDLNGEEIIGTFYEKNYRRLIKKNLGSKKWLGEKEVRHMSNGKVMIIRLIVRLIKKIYYNLII